MPLLFQGTQTLHHRRDSFQGPINLFLCREASERKAQAGSCFSGSQSHGQKHVRGLRSSGLAGGSKAGSNPLDIERDEQGLRIDAVKAQIGRVGHSGCTCTVHVAIRNRREQAGFKPITQRCDALDPELIQSEFAGLPKAGNPWNILGPGPPLTFMGATVKER